MGENTFATLIAQPATVPASLSNAAMESGCAHVSQSARMLFLMPIQGLIVMVFVLEIIVATVALGMVREDVHVRLRFPIAKATNHSLMVVLEPVQRVVDNVRKSTAVASASSLAKPMIIRTMDVQDSVPTEVSALRMTTNVFAVHLQDALLRLIKGESCGSKCDCYIVRIRPKANHLYSTSLYLFLTIGASNPRLLSRQAAIVTARSHV